MYVRPYSARMRCRPSIPVSPYRWVSPSLFDFWAGQLNPLWTLREPVARLVRREPAGEGAATLVLRTNRHWAGMRAGQHVTLGVEIEGRLWQRSYSPTALGPRELAITVKAVEGGRVSQHLVNHAQPGELFRLEAAFGEFQLPAAAPVLLLAAGSGITPMRSCAKPASARWPRRWTCSTGSAVPPSCSSAMSWALAARQPNLRVHLLTTREGDAAASIPTICRWPAMTPAGAAPRTGLWPGWIRCRCARTPGAPGCGFPGGSIHPPAPLRDASSEGEVSTLPAVAAS